MYDKYSTKTETEQLFYRIYERLHIFMYNEYNNFFNPFTGEMLLDSYKIIYHTPEYIVYNDEDRYNDSFLIMIQSNTRNKSNTKNKIYIEATSKEIVKFKHDMKILSTLGGE